MPGSDAAPRTSGAAVTILAPIGRRLLSLVYEVLLLAALLWIASLLFTAIEHRIIGNHARRIFQLYVAVVAGAYFVWQWTHGGQTLPMKTWRVRLEKSDGAPLDARTALIRYFAAMAGSILAGIGFLWAFFDRDRQFLHDRVAGTRIVRT